MAIAWILLSVPTFSQISENFNSRPGVDISQVRQHLQSQCWQFVEFDTDPNAWDPAIEGDAAMISSPSSSPYFGMGIYTPVLDVPGNISIAFKYRFSNESGNGYIRYIRIYLTDQDNNIEGMLDSIPIPEKMGSRVFNYSRNFANVGSGGYKVFINYGGTGLATRVAIDELNISANLMYSGGCNTPPVAVNDLITGTAKRSASGQIVVNDYDPDNDSFTPYVIAQPNEGTVVIAPDMSFTFTPNPGFIGDSIKFTYKVCENGPAALCSNDATVIVKFPAQGTLPVSLEDLGGNYRDNGKVEIRWVTNFESNSDRFVVERSIDGRTWEPTGTVMAKGYSTIRQYYSFIDMVGKNLANRKDLFYRLKQVDRDGSVAVSRILIVRVYNTTAVKMVSVTPNPARSDISVNLQLNEPSMVVMKIRNSNGAEVMRKASRLSDGTHSVLFEGSSRIQPGLYVMEVLINSKERMIIKLIKE